MTPVSTANRNSTAESLVRTSDLVTLPAVTLRIFQIIRDPGAGIDDLAAVVRKDPALCARMLKVVNSAHYGLPRQVHSIERAVGLLGFRGLKRVAIAANLYGMFPDTQLTSTVHAECFWTHSTAVAVGSRLLAETLTHNGGDAYLAGLIHDVGLVLEMQVRHDALAQVVRRVEAGATDFLRTEFDVMGFHHAALGEMLCEQWDFPREIIDVAGCHHRPLAAPLEHRALCAMVYIADRMAARNGLGYAGTVGSHQLDPVVLEFLNIDEATIESVERRLIETFDDD